VTLHTWQATHEHTHKPEGERREIMNVKDNYKKNKGNNYSHDSEYAEKVLDQNVKHPSGKNPWRTGNK